MDILMEKVNVSRKRDDIGSYRVGVELMDGKLAYTCFLFHIANEACLWVVAPFSA